VGPTGVEVLKESEAEYERQEVVEGARAPWECMLAGREPQWERWNVSGEGFV